MHVYCIVDEKQKQKQKQNKIKQNKQTKTRHLASLQSQAQGNF